MDDLAEFLLARIAEREAVARAAVARNGATWTTANLRDGARITGTTEFGNPRSYRGDDALWDDEGVMGMFEETAAHIAQWDPARVLAECEAKRRIVEGLTRDPWCIDGGYAYIDFTLQHLALPDADHADYRAEWKP